MTYRQFIWGLSNGVTILAIAGAFWLLLAVGTGLRPAVPVSTLPIVLPVSMTFIVVGFAYVLMASFRLRRQAAGFRLAEVREADDRTRRETRGITRGMRWVILAEAVLIAIAGFAVSHWSRPDLAWPTVGLILSLHFIALARVFRLGVYDATGIAGTCACLAALLASDEYSRVMILGFGMGIVMWLSAAYLLRNADRLATRAANRAPATIAGAGPAR